MYPNGGTTLICPLKITDVICTRHNITVKIAGNYLSSSYFLQIWSTANSADMHLHSYTDNCVGSLPAMHISLPPPPRGPKAPNACPCTKQPGEVDMQVVKVGCSQGGRTWGLPISTDSITGMLFVSPFCVRSMLKARESTRTYHGMMVYMCHETNNQAPSTRLA